MQESVLAAIRSLRSEARTRARADGARDPRPVDALRVPESLHELLDGRLARLPTEYGRLVLFAAALGRPTVELVTVAHGDRASVVDALDTAVREGVIELEDSRLRFSHPLLASICYEQAPIWKRRAIHGVLAGVVEDVEERALHMALAVVGPDAVAASYLEEAAEHAAARGAPAAAAELCELAAGLTSIDPDLTRQRRVRAATSIDLPAMSSGPLRFSSKSCPKFHPGRPDPT